MLHNNLTGMTIRFANCHICLTAVRASPYAAVNITTQSITRSFIVFNCYLFVIDMTAATDVCALSAANHSRFLRSLGSTQFCLLDRVFLSRPHSWALALCNFPGNLSCPRDSFYFGHSHNDPDRSVEFGFKQLQNVFIPQWQGWIPSLHL